jgi:hypothetical protein
MANFASATGSAITATLTPAEIDSLPSTQLQHVTAALREESELLKRFIAAEGWSSGHVYRCSPSSYACESTCGVRVARASKMRLWFASTASNYVPAHASKRTYRSVRVSMLAI